MLKRARVLGFEQSPRPSEGSQTTINNNPAIGCVRNMGAKKSWFAHLNRSLLKGWWASVTVDKPTAQEVVAARRSAAWFEERSGTAF